MEQLSMLRELGACRHPKCGRNCEGWRKDEKYKEYCLVCGCSYAYLVKNTAWREQEIRRWQEVGNQEVPVVTPDSTQESEHKKIQFSKLDFILLMEIFAMEVYVEFSSYLPLLVLGLNELFNV